MVCASLYVLLLYNVNKCNYVAFCLFYIVGKQTGERSEGRKSVRLSLSRGRMPELYPAEHPAPASAGHVAAACGCRALGLDFGFCFDSFRSVDARFAAHTVVELASPTFLLARVRRSAPRWGAGRLSCWHNSSAHRSDNSTLFIFFGFPVPL